MTLVDLLGRGDEGRTALEAIDRAPLSYGALRAHMRAAAAALRDMGLGPGDVAAMVLPNGPQAASGFLATASAGISAPLNPAYRREEFAFYLGDLNARLLLVGAELDSPARDVARQTGIRVVEVGSSGGHPAGWLTFDGESPSGGDIRSPEADAPALFLHTSGTTSRPKLVPLSHANLCASAAHIAGTLALVPGDRCLNVMPLFHIHGLVAAVLASLEAGGSVVCAPDFLAPQFFRWLAQCRPTWYTAVPTIHQAILARAGDPAHQAILRDAPLRLARSSSAALPTRTLEELERVLGVPVIEAYGMTEAAHQMASNPLPPGRRKPGTVGLAAGPALAILDPAGRPQPAGTPGEVAIKGPNVTAGYRGNAEANAAAFADGWLRTGDQGVIDGEGYLTLIGRFKEQINRAGEKISPLEVDRILEQHPAVAVALAFSMPHPILGEDVGAAVVLKAGPQVSERELREYVASRLAFFKVPRRIVFVEKMPTGPTGKPQRRGLAERLGVTADVPVDDADGTAPRTPVEAMVALAWTDVMGRPALGVRRNFFSQGGDSVLALRLVGRLRQSSGMELPLLSFFDAPTIEGISAALAPLLEQGADRSAGPPIEPALRSGPAPLSQAQLGSWVQSRLDPESPVSNLPKVVRLRGALDRGALDRALTEIVARHEVLRSTFSEREGVPGQSVAPAPAVTVPVVDLRALAGEDQDRAARDALDQDARRPFHLERDLLLRPLLVRLSDAESDLQVTFHHIAFDGWSSGVFYRELSLLYAAFAEGGSSPLPPLRLQYADFAIWDRTRDTAPAVAADRAWWGEQLDGAATSLDLWPDWPRDPAIAQPCGRVSAPLAASLADRLQALAEAEGVTLFMVMVAVFQVLLARRTGQSDFILGAATAGRNEPGTEPLLGSFVNVFPLRVPVVAPTSFRSYLGRVKTAVLAGFDHQSVSFHAPGTDQVLRWNRRQGPVFPVLFNFRNLSMPRPPIPGLTMTGFRAPQLHATHDLHMGVVVSADGVELELDYASSLYERATAESWLDGYRTMLERIVSDPDLAVDRVPMLPAAERLRALEMARGPALPTRTGSTLGTLFLEQASRTPEMPAIVAGDTTLSFAELAGRAGRLADRLAGLGAGPGDVIAIVTDRSPEMIAAMVATVLAGASYLPIDPEQPAERIRYMLTDAAVRLVLADQLGAADFGATPVIRLDRADAWSAAPGERRRAAGPEDPAYVMYTSGSTGRPKGVLVPHRAAVNHMDWFLEANPLEPDDRVFQRSPTGFDASVWEVWVPLLAGCPMVVAARDRHFDPLYLAEMIESHRITVLQLVPSLLTLFVESGALARCPTLRRVFVGGEPLTWELARSFHRSSNAELVNLYGPTETAIDATWWRSDPTYPGSTVPIGRPIANVRAHVLDEHLEPQPTGVPGELYLAGACVGLGYLNRPELTTQRFLPDRFGSDDALLYRTGDRVRYRHDGTLEYLGRIDDQIKIHGLRIEPEEIESHLNRHPGVLESAIGMTPDGRGSARLVAYVVPATTDPPSVEDLRTGLARVLPATLVPDGVVFLDRLPRTSSGKLNRRALPAPELGPATTSPPATPTEVRLAGIWSEMLGRDAIGRDDDLFALGGHSLIAIRIANRLRSMSGLDVTLRTVLDHPTVARLAGELDRLSVGQPTARPTAISRAPRVARPAGAPRPPADR